MTTGDLSMEWDLFKHDYNKQYSSLTEESERKEIFIENINRMKTYIKTHPDANYSMKINSLFDRRSEELVSKSMSISTPTDLLPVENDIDVKELPQSFDWRTKGVITDVRDQGLSGEIVTAIVSTELVESLYAISTNKLIEGSLYRVFDCCPQPVDQFECIKKMGGICRKDDYSTAQGKCEPNQCTPFTNIGAIKRMQRGLESYMLTWMQNSTLWAAIDATSINFMAYAGGVYDDDTTCSRTMMDHVLQVVGYGVEQGKPYWLCKNSWGKNWGDQGYIRIARGKNMCGIANNVVLVADPTVNQSTRLNMYHATFFMLFLVKYLFWF